MKCASALSLIPETASASQIVREELTEQLGGTTADLVLAIVSPHHIGGLARLADDCLASGLAKHILGTTVETVVAGDREVEENPAIGLWAIRFPRGVEVRPIRLSFDGETIDGWPEGLHGESLDGRTLILLADPFTFPVDQWLKLQAKQARGLRIVGGMASAAAQKGVNRLVLDSDLYSEGAVGVLLDGPVTIRTVVSQGCRPIGRSMIVTRADRNFVKELGRRPALEVLQELFSQLSPKEQALVQKGLNLGRVINEYQESFQRGDFLVRNVMGADDDGGLAITDVVRVGQTVQFHVRDAETADEDLRSLLSEFKDANVAGALLFSCNGRGTRMFPEPNHDIRVIHEILGPIPVAGFFAMGEIGPVGGENFLHGFTASIVLFSESS